MSSPLWLGIDLGTQSVRAIAVDNAGRILAQASAPLTSHRDGPRHTQLSEEWWSAVCACCLAVTRELDGRDPADALAKVARTVADWSGGTRIGETLAEFNVRWARRVLGQGAVVLFISDGWDRGDPAVLATEMARLQRSAHRLIWLNPLLGAPDYEPLARGMRTALPFVDDFLPVHNLASLEELGRHLERLPAERPLRRQQQRPRAQVAVPEAP